MREMAEIWPKYVVRNYRERRGLIKPGGNLLLWAPHRGQERGIHEKLVGSLRFATILVLVGLGGREE